MAKCVIAPLVPRKRTSVSIARSRHPCPARAGFWAPTGDGVVEVRTDFKLVLPRAEVRCSPWPYYSCVVAVRMVVARRAP